ncbi:hypothetical protein JCM11491_006318 [Sporobolomyces phaffii]
MVSAFNCFSSASHDENAYPAPAPARATTVLPRPPHSHSPSVLLVKRAPSLSAAAAVSRKKRPSTSEKRIALRKAMIGAPTGFQHVAGAGGGARCSDAPLSEKSLNFARAERPMHDTLAPSLNLPPPPADFTITSDASSTPRPPPPPPPSLRPSSRPPRRERPFSLPVPPRTAATETTTTSAAAAAAERLARRQTLAPPSPPRRKPAPSVPDSLLEQASAGTLSAVDPDVMTTTTRTIPARFSPEVRQNSTTTTAQGFVDTILEDRATAVFIRQG